MAPVWYDQTATVDGVKGNITEGQQLMGYSDRLRGRTDGRGMSVAICIDGVAMRRQRDARDARDDGALDHIWHHDAAVDGHQGNAAHGSNIAGSVHRT
jgi:hypothetical protein